MTPASKQPTPPVGARLASPPHLKSAQFGSCVGIVPRIWTRLLPRSLAWLRERAALDPEEELPDAAETFKASPLFTRLARSCAFRLEFSRPCSKARHINERELTAAIVGEARRVYRSLFSKILTLCDSQVACGCIAKGRSGSQALNILARSLGLTLALGMVPRNSKRA